MREIAEILSWNIWQMDGLKCVIPSSCHNEKQVVTTLFGDEIHEEVCQGCKKNDIHKHNGIYCYVMDWGTGKKMKFVTLLGRKNK